MPGRPPRGSPPGLHRPVEPFELLRDRLVLDALGVLGSLDAETLVERQHDIGEHVDIETPVEHRLDARGEDATGDSVLLPFFHRLEFHLALQRRQHEGQVRHSRHYVGLADAERPTEGVGEQGLVVGDGGANGNAGALVYVRRTPGLVGDLGDDLLHEGRHVDAVVAHVERRRLLFHDVDFLVDVLRVVGADLGTVAILQGGDYASPVGVVLRIGGGDQEHVERQADLVATNLHVALLEHVEEPHLDTLREVRQLVDSEDAAVHPGHEAEVDGQFVVEVASLRHLDGIDLADQVRDGDIRCRQLFRIAFRAGQPGDGRVVPCLLDDGPPFRGDRGERILRNLRALDDRCLLVEKLRETAHDPGFRLPAFTEHHDVLAAEDRVRNLRDHGLVVAHDAWEQGIAPAQLGDQVAPHLHLDTDDLVTGALEFAECGRLLAHGSLRSRNRHRVWQFGGEVANDRGQHLHSDVTLKPDTVAFNAVHDRRSA